MKPKLKNKKSFPRGMRELKGKINNKKIFGFDVETYDHNKKFLCASIIGQNYKKFYTYKKISGIESDGDINDMIKELYSNRIFRGSYIVATNLMFDFFSIFPIEKTFDCFKVIERQGGLILATSYCKYKKPYGLFSITKINEMIQEGIIKDKGRETYKITFIDSLNHLKGSVESLGEIININKLDKPDFLGLHPKNLSDWRYMKE